MALFIGLSALIPYLHGQKLPRASRAAPPIVGFTTYYGHSGVDPQFVHQKSTIGLFGFDFSPDGTLRRGVSKQDEERVKEIQSALGSKAVLTIVNDTIVPEGKNKLKDGEMVHRLVATAAGRQTHIRNILSFMGPAEGVAIDYEQVNVEDRDAFSAFIQEFAVALHAKARKLYVIVEPKTTETLRKGAGAMDYKALAAAADNLLIMGYYQHFTSSDPGPAASALWLGQIARYALSVGVSTNKLTIAVSVIGMDWTLNAEGRRVGPGKSVKGPALEQLIIKGRPEHDAEGNAFVRYADESGAPHILYFEDAFSLKAKEQVLGPLGVNMALWTLDDATPDQKIWLASYLHVLLKDARLFFVPVPFGPSLRFNALRLTAAA